MPGNTANSDSTEKSRSEKIRKLNDVFRSTNFIGGTVHLTPGISGMPNDVQNIISRVIEYGFPSGAARGDIFDPRNDPYSEHDFGHFTYNCKAGFEHSIMWKIDYYDKEKVFRSEDPTDPLLTHRVITIMLSEEY